MTTINPEEASRMPITMRPISGEFLINGVRVGTWRETAPGVVHAQAITGRGAQHLTYEAAEATVRAEITTWLSAIAGGKLNGEGESHAG